VTTRRAFIGTVTLGVLTAQLAADAKLAGRVHRIGYLSAGWGTLNTHRVGAFRQGLRELGWAEGQNIVIEYRFAEGRS